MVPAAPPTPLKSISPKPVADVHLIVPLFVNVVPWKTKKLLLVSTLLPVPTEKLPLVVNVAFNFSVAPPLSTVMAAKLLLIVVVPVLTSSTAVVAPALTTDVVPCVISVAAPLIWLPPATLMPVLLTVRLLTSDKLPLAILKLTTPLIAVPTAGVSIVLFATSMWMGCEPAGAYTPVPAIVWVVPTPPFTPLKSISPKLPVRLLTVPRLEKLAP